MENGRHIQLPVQFRSSFSSANLVLGESTLNDLSIRDCRVFSLTEVKLGTALQLRIHTSDDELPIQIGQAVVRWRRASGFGCELVNLGPDQWARLHQIVQNLEKEPFQRDQEDSEVV